jgi:23S rRNA pseudouridine2457 synthase
MLRYYLFHKPYEVLCQFSPEEDKQTLAHFIKGIPADVYPVGRLDFDSEGLLLLTNDKQLIHRLLEPRFAHPRTYWVQVEGEASEDALNRLRKGVDIRIKGVLHHTRPAIVQAFESPPDVWERHPPVRFRKHIPTSWLSITLTEGKNRQVRRMTAAAGLPTLRLIRWAIGPVSLQGLEPGALRDAGPEIKNLLLSKL